jgi:LmbE family N-acetylglucosaminyl deacetylase
MSGHSSILVLAPHPDDELVGACIAMKRAMEADARLSVLYLTTGIAAESWPWERKSYALRVRRRHDEALQAARRLGFEVAGFLDMPSRRLIDHLDAVRAVVSKFEAKQVWVPAFEGAHQDHDAANALASTICAKFEVSEFAEYNFAGGQVRSNRFHDGAGDVVMLSREEARLKKELLGLYKSERGNLDYISCDQESLRPLAKHDYAKPAHAGILFRERFRWVPFKHPRIDWRPQAEISRCLSQFVSRFS